MIKILKCTAIFWFQMTFSLFHIPWIGARHNCICYQFGCGGTNVWRTRQSFHNLLLLPLPGQLVLSGGSRVNLGPCEGRLVPVPSPLVRDVIYLWGHRLTLLHRSLARLHNHTHLQQVLGPSASNLYQVKNKGEKIVIWWGDTEKHRTEWTGRVSKYNEASINITVSPLIPPLSITNAQ